MTYNINIICYVKLWWWWWWCLKRRAFICYRLTSAAMASFSHYASKFLNQSQPIFYSVQGDDRPVHDDDTSPFHDHRDRRRTHVEEYDPFNLEEIADQDEDDGENDGHPHNEEEVLDDGGGGNDVQDSLPLLLQSQSKWRQHISPSPPHSPASSASSSTGSPPMNLDLLLEESLPPPTLSQPSRMPPQQTLTESLLPTADTFLLPVVGRTPRRKFHDLPWAYTWLVALGICTLGSVITLFIVSVSIASFVSPVAHPASKGTPTATGPPPLLDPHAHSSASRPLHTHCGYTILSPSPPPQGFRSACPNGHFCCSTSNHALRSNLCIRSKLLLDWKG